MTTKYYFFYFLFIFLLSCEEEKPKSNQNDHNKSKSDQFSKEDSIKAYKDLINEYDYRINEGFLIEANSLTYSNEDVEKDVTLYLDPQNNNTKLKMVFTTKKIDLSKTEIFSFYFLNKKNICSKKVTKELRNQQYHVTEKISYYDSSGVFLCRQRVALEEELENTDFKFISNETHSMREAEEIIGQIGKYETNFKNIMKYEKDYYLIVGENKKNGFHAVLNVSNPDKKFLKLDNKKNVGKKLIVQFDKEKNEDDWFQVLKSFEFSNK